MVKGRTKLSILALAIMLAVTSCLMIFGPSNNVSADNFSAQIDALQKQINELAGQKKVISEKADTLANKVAELQNEQKLLQAEIDLNNTKKEDLTAKINENTKKLDNQQKSLAQMLVDLYFEGDIDTLKILAGSKSISDYAERVSRKETAQRQVSASAKNIREIKKQLETQKLEIEQILSELAVKKGSLDAIKSQQQQLLAETRGEEAEYSKRISNTQAELARVEAARQAAMEQNGGYNSGGSVAGFAWRNASGPQGCGGDGYPYCAGPLDYTIDEFQLYARECVSYAAWAAKYKYNRTVNPFGGLGHAYMWEWSAPLRTPGTIVDRTPKVGAVALMPRNSLSPIYGHVMIVDYLLDDGWVGIGHYNWFSGVYSTMEVWQWSVLYIHFPPR